MDLDGVEVTYEDADGAQQTKTLRAIVGELGAGLVPDYVWDLAGLVQLELTPAMEEELRDSLNEKYLKGKGRAVSIAFKA